MVTKVVYLPKAMAHQREILLSPARFKVVACGRRWGKTGVGLLATLKGHGSYRGQFRGAIDGGNIWWVAPTFVVARKIWRDLKKACRNAWVDKSEIEKRIELPGGGSVTVMSADNPDGLRGDGLDGVVMDEAAFTDEKVWKESIRPALSDKLGWAIFISTPQGKNWFHEIFQRAGNDGATTWARWQRPTSDNPLIPESELREAELDVGSVSFAQEYLAQFTDRQGTEFSGSYFNEKIWFDDWPELRAKVLTLDPSKGKSEKSDYAAFVMLGLGHDGTLYCDANLERIDVSRIVDYGIDLARTWAPEGFGVEVNQFQELLATQFIEKSKQNGMMLPIFEITNTTNKVTRIRATLTPFLSRGEIKFKRSSRGAKLLVDQLREFPIADHDDGPDALEMGVRLMRHLVNSKETHNQIREEFVTT
jgi:predicted phage terminase large subunit-like protein